MKKITALLLAISFLLTGCGFQENVEISEVKSTYSSKQNKKETEMTQNETEIETEAETESETEIETETEPNFITLSDPALHTYVKDSLSENLASLDTEKYKVENVEVVYYSKEFLDELEYNSKENIYFGYTLSELEEQFQGEKYIFTLGENGETVVKTFEDYDDSKEKLIRNVAIGAGVIIICVTVIALAPEASGAVAKQGTKMVFAVSSKSAKELAKDASINLLGNVVDNTIDYATDPDKEIDFKDVLKDSLIDTSLDTLGDISIYGISGKINKKS